jgi:hypothetical protein
MLNDLLPAIFSVAIVAGAFLCAWVADGRRIRRSRRPGFLQRSTRPTIEIENGEPMEMWTESSDSVSSARTPLR